MNIGYQRVRVLFKKFYSNLLCVENLMRSLWWGLHVQM